MLTFYKTMEPALGQLESSGNKVGFQILFCITMVSLDPFDVRLSTLDISFDLPSEFPSNFDLALLIPAKMF